MKPRPSLTLRKPAVTAAADVDAFINGAELPAEPALSVVRDVETPPSAPAAEKTAPQPTASVTFRRADRSIARRKTRPDRRRATVYFDLDLVERLAEHCANKDIEMSDAVNDALRQFLGRA
jgi:hypothetical protein